MIKILQKSKYDKMQHNFFSFFLIKFNVKNMMIKKLLLTNLVVSEYEWEWYYYPQDDITYCLKLSIPCRKILGWLQEEIT